MAKDLNPDILRKKANDLIKQAKEIEEKQFVRIGKVVYDYLQKDFEGFELETFKGEVKEAMEGKKRGRKTS